jgi:hypothetical protein
MHEQRADRVKVVMRGGAPPLRQRHDLFAAIAPVQGNEAHALLRAGAGRRGTSAFLSSAMLRRSVSGAAQLSGINAGRRPETGKIRIRAFPASFWRRSDRQAAKRNAPANLPTARCMSSVRTGSKSLCNDGSALHDRAHH